MTVPPPGTQLKITSMGSASQYLQSPIKTVTLLGSTDPLNWKQNPDALEITCPKQMPLKIAVVFKITPAAPL
jgi:alpha-L-fucosidase